MQFASYDTISISLDNLIRLGLIEIPYGTSYTNKDNYEPVRNTTNYIKIKKELESIDKGTVSENKKLIKPTALAKSFYSICVKE